MARNLMLLPTLACPASCQYCFGPHQGKSIMQAETIAAIAEWIKIIDPDDQTLNITFHGGEPLIPGIGFYRMALPLLQTSLDSRDVRFSIQSNLWLLTDQLCDLFGQYNVSLGTSLDGPEQINDAQRGEGYFQRTMAGIQRARSHNLGVGCIATFTSQSTRKMAEVFAFFANQNLDFSVHAALPPLGHASNGWALSADAFGELMVDLLDLYLPESKHIRVNTLDVLARSISAGHSSVCTFGDCLGHYLAVDPDGNIYPCQRFAGNSQYQLGNVHNQPKMEDLANAPFWQMLDRRQKDIDKECGDCAYLNICRGGCPYNVLTANNGNFKETLRDPYCSAYKRIFSTITDRALDEVFSQENMNALVSEKNNINLLSRGSLSQIMRGEHHPKDTARQAREMVAAAALGASHTPEQAFEILDQLELVTNAEQTIHSIQTLKHRLDTQSQDELINAYLHVTYRCNLQCTHCYAQSGTHETAFMEVDQIADLLRQTATAGFRKAVITGGEPLMHPQRDDLLDTLQNLRTEIQPLKTVLRTNLAGQLPPDLLVKLANSTDQVVISVDGDQRSHDARRGKGSYAHTLANIRALLALKPRAKVAITAVLTAEQAKGEAGESVRTLAADLGIKARIKSVLPLGRGTDLNLTPALYSSPDVDSVSVVMGSRPTATCGLGMNLYIAPDGECYPCYTLMGSDHYLGNVFHEGLPAILANNNRYRKVTVDSNSKCRKCAIRYLCGGFCRVWSQNGDPDSPPSDCSALFERAQRQLAGALEFLELTTDHWADVVHTSESRTQIRNVASKWKGRE